MCQEMRLNKYLSDVGVCSRREADRWIEAGRVMVDGIVAVMGQKIQRSQTVLVDGKPVKKEEEKVLLAFNKPKGIVCTTSKKDKDNIVDFINYKTRIYPIGRLDKDSEGLILLTNQGELVDKILRGSNFHEKEYIVTVNRKITPEFIRAMGQGVPILDVITRACEIEAIGTRTFRIILTQGLNRQIRRMCEYFDYRVVDLQRVRVMNIRLGRLKTGTYRKIVGTELKELLELLEKR
ncbi:MAG: pseudouridine synthase [Lachnospiraceae bacterium]|nr:pseudouridine synthase [Lachnospiraceae bacterium]MCI8772302.1 pseudouridine synthase [Lachnospiraceae bacterium]